MKHKLPEPFKTQWLSDLRSGKIKQGRSVLRGKDETMCCLGVACNIIDPSGWHLSTTREKWMWHIGCAMPDGVRLMSLNHQIYDCLNQPVDPEAAIGFCDGTVICGSTVENALATMNDGKRSFAEIADWIEEHL